MASNDAVPYTTMNITDDYDYITVTCTMWTIQHGTDDRMVTEEFFCYLLKNTNFKNTDN